MNTASSSQTPAIGLAESAEYDTYVRAEWALFSSDPQRACTADLVMNRVAVRRVLDVGCGAGQEMRPFVARPGVVGVGVDLSPEVGRAGRALFAQVLPGKRVLFARGDAEALPFRDALFDVVICRLALPYTRNRAALGEMRRVLAPGGVILLKIHHARFYLLKLREAVLTRKAAPAAHACRVLAAGVIYHATGRQPRNRITGPETFQTRWLLARELRRHGLEIRAELPDSLPAAPSLLIGRRDAA